MAGAIGDGPGRGLTPRGWGFTHICWLLTSSGEPGGLVTGCCSQTAGTHRPVCLGTGPTEKLPNHTARRLAHHCVPPPHSWPHSLHGSSSGHPVFLSR